MNDPRKVVALGAAIVAGMVAQVAPALAAAPSTGPTPALAPNLADPPQSVRPKYRWWQPLAATDDAELRAELRQMKEGGAGGAEVVAFAIDGVRAGDPLLQRWGWGTPTWEQKTRAMLEGARDSDLSFAMTIGPLWPAAVPGVDDINDRRIQQQLVFAYEDLDAGEARSGALPANDRPAPPAGAETTLVAVLAARCAAADCASQTSGPRLLDPDSVVDLTRQVTSGGDLTWTAPDDGGTWQLIVLRQTASGQNRGFGGTVVDLLPSGKGYTPDHLSVAGARLTTDFWDEHLLTPQVRQLIDQLDGGTEFFEDSLELDTTTKWTWRFAEEWRDRRGYDPATSLPALAGIGREGTDAPFWDFPGGLGDRIRTDYKQTFSDLYVEKRMNTFHRWARERGMTTRTQSYGEPIDTVYASSRSDVPEGESFGFSAFFGTADPIERFKTSIVGAQLGDAKIASTECCADFNRAWSTTMGGTGAGNELWQIYQELAGGATQIVWHGFPYLTAPEGFGPRALWPGFSFSGANGFAESFGPRMPQWAAGDIRTVNDHVGRLQLALRQGKPRFDVSVYWQQFATPDGLLRNGNALQRAGYTNSYLSPEYLRRDDAQFKGGRLFPDKTASKALLLLDQRTLPLDTARTLRELARAGLPIVIAGALPQTIPGRDTVGDDTRLRAVVDQLLALPSVARVASVEEVPAALERLGVRASAARASDAAALLSVRRQTADGDLYYLFNNSRAAVADRVTLEGDGAPYLLDTWTGATTPIARYERTAGGVTVDVRLAPLNATVIALSDDPAAVGATRAADAVHATATDADALVPGAPGVLRVRSASARTVTTTLSDGRTVASALPDVPAARTLRDWSLTAESWTPGATGLPGDTVRTTLAPVAVSAAEDGRLPAWSALPPLQDVSGTGVYTTTVELPAGWSGGHGAWLDLGAVVDTAVVTVNGTRIAPVDPQDTARIDISGALRPGANTIEVRVASTLFNAVRVAPGSGIAARARQDYGLLGPVVLTPYGEAEIALAPGGEQPRPPVDPGQPRPPVDPPRPPAGDRVKPRISGVATSGRTIRRGTAASVRFRLSERARVRVVVARRLDGRRAGRRCLTGAKTPRRGGRCVVWKTLRGTAVNGRAGANRITLLTRAQSRRAPLGTYRVTLVATDPAGNRSAPVRAAFRLVRGR